MPCADRNRCACFDDLNRCICRSRLRVGRCEFSARLFKYRLVRCRTSGKTFTMRGIGNGSVQQVGGSGGHCQLRALGGGRLKEVAESRAERAVVDRAADLQQQVCTSARPSHLLRFVHPPIDQEVRRAFGNRCSDTQAGTISFGVIDEPGALAAEIVVDLMQCAPQLARWHAPSCDGRVRP